MEVDTFGSDGVEKIVLDDHVEVDGDTMIDVAECFGTCKGPRKTSLGVAKDGSINDTGINAIVFPIHTFVVGRWDEM